MSGGSSSSWGRATGRTPDTRQSREWETKITQSKGGTLTVEYEAWTDIDNESFAPMQWKWKKVFNGTPQYTGGYFAGYRVDIRWQETIYK